MAESQGTECAMLFVFYQLVKSRGLTHFHLLYFSPAPGAAPAALSLSLPTSPTLSPSSSSSRVLRSAGGPAREDTLWVLLQDDEGSVVGSRLVSIKAMEDKEVDDVCIPIFFYR